MHTNALNSAQVALNGYTALIRANIRYTSFPVCLVISLKEVALYRGPVIVGLEGRLV